MDKIMGKVEAFAAMGVKLRNDQWSWCGVSSNGVKVFTAWDIYPDWHRDPDTKLYHYHATYWDMAVKNGGREMTPMMLEALASNERVQTVACYPVDKNADTWRVQHAKPMLNQWWQVNCFDPQLGKLEIDELPR